MTPEEFEAQFERMVIFYGSPRSGLSREWQRLFGDWDAAVFEDAVTKVISQYRPFGQDRWPTPGDFNHVLNSSEEEYHPFAERS